jgi:NADH-quinone oxidoreductase subunit C
LVSIISITSLYSTSLWLEREAFDLFGVLFIYNKDLRRILTDYGFRGYPLRKDFPLSGFIDLFYDDNEKRIVYKTLEFSQELKQYSFKKLWF